ncbi:phage antirepressor N-terminal domain-containing protein [Roseospira navarrensis]|uniref:Helix-turn-helix domain-containing protein n=1 Tax=Roseospira navarrensis TaxID=140058 RepID=A0A7X1ZHM5_9PROT|nr:phage antirepressor N-terminal domain-containing protein [Roseospira navarrensis]MQX38547.1 helix-turn-helix domain-containing protein [Roseospira navarrensis]
MSQANHFLTTVPFEGANLIVRPGRTPVDTLVAMKPLVEGMGLEWEGQRQRIARHPVLKGSTSVFQVETGAGPRDTLFLPLIRVNFFLATIHPERVTDEAVRKTVIAYQTRCADVLFKEFFGKAVAASQRTTTARGRSLRTRRQRLGLSGQQLANLSGVSDNTIRRIEDGEREGSERTWLALDSALQAARRDIKAERDRKNATVRLQFTVPVDKAGAVCNYVSSILQSEKAEG